jgi:hypothetical protein
MVLIAVLAGTDRFFAGDGARDRLTPIPPKMDSPPSGSQAGNQTFSWVDTNTSADWGGRDYAYTSGNYPKYSVKDVTLCDSGKSGYIATCWDSRPEGYPSGISLTDIPAGTAPALWCTYKNNLINLATPPDGKALKGRVYVCGRSIQK